MPNNATHHIDWKLHAAQRALQLVESGMTLWIGFRIDGDPLDQAPGRTSARPTSTKSRRFIQVAANDSFRVAGKVA